MPALTGDADGTSPLPATAETANAAHFSYRAVWHAIRSQLVWSWQKARIASHGVRSFCATRINPRHGATRRGVLSEHCCIAPWPTISSPYCGLRASRTKPASACQSMSNRNSESTCAVESHVTDSLVLRARLAAAQCSSPSHASAGVVAAAARRAVCATPQPSSSIASFPTYR